MLHKQHHSAWTSCESIKALCGHYLITNSSLRCMPSLKLIRSALLPPSLTKSSSMGSLSP
eukprot:c4556_g1_i1 orf=3-179(-)